MEGLSLPGRLEKISEALVLADLSDFVGLAKLHTEFEAFVRTAEGTDLDPRAIEAARLAAQAVETIVLEEAKDPAQALAHVAKIATQLQRMVTGEASGNVAEELAASATMTPVDVQLPANVDERILTDFLARQASHGAARGAGAEARAGRAPAAAPARSRRPRSSRSSRWNRSATPRRTTLVAWRRRRRSICCSRSGLVAASLRGLRQEGERRPPPHEALIQRLADDEAGFRTCSAAGPQPLAWSTSRARCHPRARLLQRGDRAPRQRGSRPPLESNPSSPEAINAVFRAFHTLKGAGMISAKEIGEVAHEAENLLDKTRKGVLQLRGPLMDVTFASETVDTLKRMVGGLKTSATTAKCPAASRITRLDPTSAAGRQRANDRSSPGRGKARRPGRRSAVEIPTTTAVQRVQVKETVKVDADRLDRLVGPCKSVSWSLPESMVSQSPEMVAALNSVTLTRQLGQLDKITRELQEMAPRSA
ncbi:MAG: Hpt domain-containing protein [Candidatus Eisenbacteria bacterium]